MIILYSVISLFVFLEVLNVILLYFAPSSTKGNGVGVFKAYEKSKAIPEVHALVKYLINWVAGTKLIFIALLLVILITAPKETIIFTTIALVVSIASFFWRLYPIIKQMDKEHQLSPKGYALTLGRMIFGFISVFIIALGVTLVFLN